MGLANLKRESIVRTQAEMRRMSNELSGCDWCCGGGDEQWGYLKDSIARDRKWLLENNEHLPQEDQSIDCSMCNHFTATREGAKYNEPLCARCFETFESEA